MDPPSLSNNSSIIVIRNLSLTTVLLVPYNQHRVSRTHLSFRLIHLERHMDWNWATLFPGQACSSPSLQYYIFA